MFLTQFDTGIINDTEEIKLHELHSYFSYFHGFYFLRSHLSKRIMNLEVGTHLQPLPSHRRIIANIMKKNQPNWRLSYLN